MNAFTSELDRARDALTVLDARDSDIWLKVAMAIKSEFGAHGWAIFDEWSRTAPNYHPRQNTARWKSVKQTGGISIATLYFLAREQGWRGSEARQSSANRPARQRCVTHVADREVIEAKRRQAALKAVALWALGTRADAGNPYCKRKAIAPTDTLREIEVASAAAVLGYRPCSSDGHLQGLCLLVPIKADGGLTSVQLIDGARRKHFLAGGALKGGYWASERLPRHSGAGLTLLIGEGVATVLSARVCADQIGIAAMMNSNLPAVAKLMRARFPESEIIILADLDKLTGGPDRYAISAAGAIGCRMAVPDLAAARIGGAP